MIAPSRDSRKTRSANVRGVVALAGYALLLLACGWAFKSAVWPAREPAPFTRLEAGTHATLVLIAPTSKPTRELASAVKGATAALAERTNQAGLRFSTVGISDDWSVTRGMKILEEFGRFDEVIVGRNWFNSGVVRFIDEMNGPPVVPQLLVVRQEKRIDQDRWTSGPVAELVRVVGKTEIRSWAARGFPVPLGISESTARGIEKGSLAAGQVENETSSSQPEGETK